MYKIAIIYFVVTCLAATGCGSGSGNKQAASGSGNGQEGQSQLVFTEYQHDFGKVTAGEKVSYTFNFENKGTADLIISSATASCGCTVPKYDSKPIRPGGKGDLEVVFDTSGREGRQTKIVTVKSNAATPVVMVRITADVIPESN